MDLGVVVLDGWGLNPDSDARDAVAAAETPTVDGLRERGASTTLTTHGRRVGLPDGQMGNSEVGHLNIGAGRVVTQESARITDAIARWRGEASAFENPTDPPLADNDAIDSVIKYAQEHDGRLHLIGLVSDGGVHSYQSHLHALIDLAAVRGVEAVTHAITDGRDTSPTGGREYLRSLSEHADDAGTGGVATVCGRYYAMDRDENWERTKRAYDAIVDREAAHTAPSVVAAVESSYDRDVTDEFVEPTLVEGGPALRDGDGVVFVNFRSDRARQLTRMLADIDPEWPAETNPPDCRLVTMTEYDSDFDVPVAFPAVQPDQTLGQVLAEAGRTQLRIAETEKYAHVTYFFNGGREIEFEGERREIVPSPDVPTYDERPEMSAPDVTDRATEVIDAEDPDVVVLNYANPDMVGHTGDFEAAVAAVEAADTQLARLVEAMQAAGADVLVTADHGNADDMGTPENPHTAHTTNPVPFVYVSADGDGGGRTARGDGALEDIAPTVLDLLSIPKPAEMTGESLL
ncbi:2,3-bisphosphoglycerate-independent phosphoglycerate mutase [Halovenus salina]|uniref:2,3-bisphosphoglycerate-independent phosphoglycerate mutase n=1 Tax=Halovenus salina TaxID=1510225 RepID=UPI0022609258|nr:2,3-bisphosphoglycerate-independent phosphoglycerate mutase [Halovenus salina]